MTRLSLLAAALLVAQTLTEKIDVSVVNVDVTVIARNGEPVRGLTRDDFQVFEDGVPQAITNFYAVEGAPDASTARAEDERFRRKVLVLIDNNHVTRRGRDLALKNLEEFVNDRFRGGEYDWSIAAIGSHVGMMMPPTSDKARIHEALQAIRGAVARADRTAFADAALRGQEKASIDVRAAEWSAMNRGLDEMITFAHDADERERTMQADFTANAIIEAARGFAGAGGKKVILLLTDDPGLNDIDLSYSTAKGIEQRTVSAQAAETAKGITGLRSRIVEEANASNVSLYIINPEGLRPPGDMSAEAAPMTSNQGLFWLAEETGGRMMPGNDGAAAIRQFDSVSSTFYSLGFRPDHTDDGKYHRLEVRLKTPNNYKLQHRSGYSSVPPDAQLERALLSPMAGTMDSAALPVTLTLKAPQPDRRGSVVVPFEAEVPLSKLQFLPEEHGWSARIEVYVSVFDGRGRNIVLKRFATSARSGSAEPDPTANFVYRNGIALRKGREHRIVVAVRDQATDAVGMALKVVRF